MNMHVHGKYEHHCYNWVSDTSGHTERVFLFYFKTERLDAYERMNYHGICTTTLADQTIHRRKHSIPALLGFYIA